MKQQVGIFGYPLGHSISPAFQQAAFDYYSLPVRYQAWPTRPEELGENVKGLRSEYYLGANVTIPHKERVIVHIDDIDPWAGEIGAVNTIVRANDRLLGYNTDTDGFIRSLKEFSDFEPKGKKILILGAGGAARAAVFGLVKENVAALTIANRTIGRALVLAHDINARISNVRAISLDKGPLLQASTEADLIVNSTSLGMKHGSTERTSPMGSGFIPSNALVLDMVYNPAETPLLRQARNAGAVTIGGLPMLIYQGAAAFELWTGREAPIQAMFKAGEKALLGL